MRTAAERPGDAPIAQPASASPCRPSSPGHGDVAPGVNAEALYLETGWQLIVLSNGDPPGASRMLAALESSVFTDDPAAGW